MKKKTGESRCLECGAPVHGRSDKKFCSLTCKNNYNNRLGSKKNSFKKCVLMQLTRNYKVLEELLSTKQLSASFEELSILGFDKAFLTGAARDSSCHVNCSCFDISYYQTPTKIFRIRRKEPTKF